MRSYPMKCILRIIFLGLALVLPISCGKDQSDDNKTDIEIEPTISSSVLVGNTFEGEPGQGGKIFQGVEGSGNSGFITFLDDHNVTFLHPGDDQVITLAYVINGNIITIEDGITLQLTDDGQTLKTEHWTFHLNIVKD